MAQRTCPSCNVDLSAEDTVCPACGARLQPDAFIGATLGNLQIIRLLGEGAMGTVYLARHVVLQTPYAVKVLLPEFSQDRMAAERFRQEAMLGSTLRHPNIAFVTDFGFKPSLGLYLVMEYLPGRPLSDLIDDEEQMGLWRTITISKQLCAALEAAHILGAVHRDLKPDNIFILNQGGQRDKVKVLDWGLARLVYDRSRRLVQEGVALGTPVYMSPEQISGDDEDIGPASDIYALGLVIFEMLVGQPPFDDDDSQIVMGMHLDDEPDQLSDFRPELEGTFLDELIDQMLAKDPAERPRSMREVKEQLGVAFRQLQEMGLPDMVPETISGALVDAARTAQRFALAQTSAPPNDLFGDPEEDSEATLLEHLVVEVPGLSKLSPALFFTTGWWPVETVPSPGWCGAGRTAAAPTR
ncbi:MAG: protein kinase, partial [Myxococcota bacterium]